MTPIGRPIVPLPTGPTKTRGRRRGATALVSRPRCETRGLKSWCLNGVAAVVLAGAAHPAWPGVPQAEQLRKVIAALPAAQVKPLKPRKLLVFTRTTDSRDASIELGAEAVRLIGDNTGAYLAYIRDDVKMFEPATLRQFDAVLMLSTSGEPLKPALPANASAADAQAAADLEKRAKQSLLDFVRSGKGFAAIHAATDAYWRPGQEWPEYEDMIGGAFDGHPWDTAVGIAVEDKGSPLTKCFSGPDFDVADEIYTFKSPPYSRATDRVLLALDLARTPGNNLMNRADNDYAVAWIKRYGQGRVFYCSLGHREEVFWNPTVLQFYLNGLQYALGDLKADDTPLPQPRREIPVRAAGVGVLEAEGLTVLSKTDGTTETQDMTQFGDQWSGHTQMWWTRAQPGARLTLAVPVAAAGKYAVSAQLTRAIDYATVQMYFDDRKLGDPIDLYHAGVVPTGAVMLGTLDLTAGAHTWTVEITGANDQAIKNYMVGLDYLQLVPVR